MQWKSADNGGVRTADVGVGETVMSVCCANDGKYLSMVARRGRSELVRWKSADNGGVRTADVGVGETEIG